MYIRLSAAIDPRDRARTVRQLIELCRSTSWRLNQYIGAFVYSWFLAAFFLIYHHRSLCSDNILYLTFFGNVILFIIHMGVSWMWMRRIFHVDRKWNAFARPHNFLLTASGSCPVSRLPRYFAIASVHSNRGSAGQRRTDRGAYSPDRSGCRA